MQDMIIIILHKSFGSSLVKYNKQIKCFILVPFSGCESKYKNYYKNCAKYSKILYTEY